MQERTNKRLAISLLLLTVVTLAVFAFIGRDASPQVNKDLFKIDELEKIDRIVLTGRSTLTLHYNGNRWRVNDRYDADPALIRILFATLQQAQPRRPVSRSLADSLSREIQTSGIKVSLFSEDVLKKSFYTGGNAAKTQSYFLPESGENVYLMTIPGYRVYLTGYFELKEQEWRNKAVISFHWRNFKELRMKYPARSSNDFEVKLMNNVFGVPGIDRTDTMKLASYMDRVFAMEVQEYITNPKTLDSLRKLTPEAILTLTDIANNDHVINIYPSENEQVMILFEHDQLGMVNRSQIRIIMQPKAFFKARE